MAERGVDQVSLARDLAHWLQRKQDKIDLADYRLSAYLPLLALLPILVAFAAALTLGSDLWHRDLVWLMIASISGIAISILVFLWSYAGYPSVRVRVIFILLIALISNGVVGTLWLHREGQLLETLALLPFGPGSPIAKGDWVEFVDPNKNFVIEMPGQAKHLPEEAPPKGCGSGRAGLFTKNARRAPIHFVVQTDQGGTVRTIQKRRLRRRRFSPPFPHKCNWPTILKIQRIAYNGDIIVIVMPCSPVSTRV